MRQDRHYHRQNSALAAGSLFPFVDDFTTGSSLSSRWFSAGTWTLAAGKAENTPVTLGVEQLTNPGLEPPYVAGVANGWTQSGATGVLSEENIIVNEGVSSQKLHMTGNNLVAMQTKAIDTGRWYYSKAYAYVAAGGTNLFKHLIWTNFPAAVQVINIPITAPTDTWLQLQSIFPHYAASMQYDFRSAQAGISDGYCDNTSCKVMTTAELMAAIESGVSTATVKANTTLGNSILCRIPVGVVCGLDSFTNPQNYILSYHDGSVFRTMKCLGGVLSILHTQLIAYVASAIIMIQKTGATIKCFYNGVQYGGDFILASPANDAIINATKWGMFNGGNGNTLDNFSVS